MGDRRGCLVDRRLLVRADLLPTKAARQRELRVVTFMTTRTPCQITIAKSCFKDGYVQGTITGMKLTNGEHVEATVTGTFTAGCH